MWGPLHEGPSHISVDGTTSNAYVFVAVVILAAGLALSAYASFVLKNRFLRLLLWCCLILCCVESRRVYHRVAFELQSATIRTRIPTTFFGAPPLWIAPAAVGIGGVMAALVLSLKRRRVQSANES